MMSLLLHPVRQRSRGRPGHPSPSSSLLPCLFPCLTAFGLALLAFPPFAHAETRFVSLTGLHAPPFTTWADAATNLQAAIDFCSPDDVVVVSNGTYLLDATVQVTNEVTLTSLNGRDTVLLDGSALPAGSDAVFLQFGTLDGLTVSHAPRHGVKSEYGHIANSRITHSGQTGIDSYTTPRIVTNSTLVVTNTIVEHSGLNGIYTCAVDTRILGCLITGSAGSGVALRQNDTTGTLQVPRVSNFLIRASTVSSNLNSGISLAFWNYSASFPDIPVLIDDCIIEDNSGAYGGGVADAGGTSSDRSSGVQITGSIIRRNSASVRGGGVAFLNNRSPSIRDSIVEDNWSATHGGGVYLGSGTVENCLIRNNTCLSDGGGVWRGEIFNSTLIFNRANRGGGTFQSTVRNSIVYYNENGNNSYTNNYGGSLAYTCTIPAVSGTGNITAPPSLAGFRSWRLVPGSPCIDSGGFWFAAGDYDLDGEPRIWGPGVDMGCDEFYTPNLAGPLSVEVEAHSLRAVVGAPLSFRCDVEGRPEAYRWDLSDGFSISNIHFIDRSFDSPGLYTATVTAWNPDGAASNSITFEIFPGYTNYVSSSGLHQHPFTNWSMAATHIQDAISANIPGGVVVVDDGIYDQGSVSVHGGLPSRIAITNLLDVISRNGPDHTRLVGQGPLGEEAIRCALIGDQARLIGFTLTNGHTWTSGHEEYDQSGGGAWCESGGALEDCRIRDNAAQAMGGGVRNGAVRRSTLQANHAEHGGGSHGAVLSQCILSNNSARGEGGGAHSGSVENSWLIRNQAEYGGGVAGATLNHATVVQNHAAVSGGGFYRGVASNSIVYFNTAGVSWSNYFNAVCRYCCTAPDPQSIGNTTDDPLFVDMARDAFRLLGTSPAVDAAAPTDLAMDLLGVPRPLPGILGESPAPDMGAYEYTAAHYVALDGGHVFPFATWANAASDLQSAIDAADPRDQVLVSNGVYQVGGRLHRGLLTNRVIVTLPIQMQSVNGHLHTVIEGSGPVGDSAVRPVVLATNAVLAGFTIRGGATRTAGDSVDDQSGGGIWAAPDAVLSNCVVESCSANASGGGVYGGRLVNSFLHDNQAVQGGGLAMGQSDFSTLAWNHAAEGGGAYNSSGRASILYHNTASASAPNISGGAWNTCCTTPDPGGIGHITNDPQFLAAGDCRLALDSPCIDAMAPDPFFPDMDLDGIPRPLDGRSDGQPRFDIGAHESVHPTADTDGDALNDIDEILIHATHPLRPDTDVDGQTDGGEILTGTDPLDPDSFFALLRTEDAESHQLVQWPGLAGRLYTILATDDLMTGIWSNRPDSTDFPGVTGIMTFTNDAPPGIVFYRVRARWAP